MVKSEKPKRFYAPNITVRVSEPTKKKLEASAAAHDRSLRQEIEARIQASFEAEDLAAILVSDRSLLAPLVIFARHYGRILKIANVAPESKLALGLAGELFRHTAQSFIGGSMPLGLADSYEYESQGQVDHTVSQEAVYALSRLIDDNPLVADMKSSSIAMTIVEKCRDAIAQERNTAPQVFDKTYRAIHSFKEAMDEARSAERISEQMSWLNDAVLRTTANQGNINDAISE